MLITNSIGSQVKQVIVYNCLISPTVYNEYLSYPILRKNKITDKISLSNLLKTFRPDGTEVDISSQIIFEFILHYIPSP